MKHINSNQDRFSYICLAKHLQMYKGFSLHFFRGFSLYIYLTTFKNEIFKVTRFFVGFIRYIFENLGLFALMRVENLDSKKNRAFQRVNLHLFKNRIVRVYEVHTYILAPEVPLRQVLVPNVKLVYCILLYRPPRVHFN
jgi:hypothetical protein